MSKRRAPARSGTSSPASFTSSAFGSSAMGGFASSTTSVLSFIGEPPDLSQISDPSVVVLFKNLSKKEEVTKAKALEGLLTALDSVESIEEALLSAWVRLYPRLSIDVSARVRRLSNSLQGLIGVKSGKKLARHMAKIVGPWLCGLFDSDRGSARATLESLLKVFKSEEKLKTIWKAYHAAILEFCKTSVASESVYSLSDERWVVPDDAEAKFARIMATCCLAVAHLITNQPSEELDESYREFFGEKTLWTFTFHADPFLRRAVYRLLQDTLERRPEWIVSNLEMVSTALIMKASAKSQVASVTTYLETLVALTKQFPESWSMAKPAKKKTPLAQFVSFVEHGSQVAPPSYWDQVSSVLMILPKDVLAVQEEGTKSVLTGILKGIKAGPEPRSHMTAAWGCYWDCCYRFLDLQFSWSGFDDFLLQQSIFAVYDGYVSGCQPKDRCFISNDDAVAATVCGNGLVKLDHLSQGTAVKVLDEAWEKVEGSVISTVRAERSDTVANAPAVKRCAETWVKLVVGVLKQLPKNGVVYQAIVKSNIAVFAELIESLLFTNGKAGGAAVFTGMLLEKVGTELLKDPATLSKTSSFFLEKLPGILEIDTVETLLGAFVSYGAHTTDVVAFQEGWKKMIHALMMSALSKEKKENSIILLLNSASVHLVDKVSPVPELDTYIVNKMRGGLLEQEIDNSWVLVKDALNTAGNVVSQETTSRMLAELMDSMSIDVGAEKPQLSKALNAIAGTNPHKLLPFVNSDHGKELISKLLALANSPDNEISSSATRLRDVVNSVVSKTSDEEIERFTAVTVDNICESVQVPTSEHMSIEYLAAKANSLISDVSGDSMSDLVEKLLFTDEQWESALRPFLGAVKNLSLAITNPLGGSIFLVNNDSPTDAESAWDTDGYSTVLRMAMFAMKFVEGLEDTPNIISSKTKGILLRHILLVQELLKDKLSVAHANDIWKENSPEVEAEIIEFTSSTQQWAVSALNSDIPQHEFAPALVDKLLERCGGSSAAAFYSARALYVAMSDLCENDQFFRDKAVAWTDANDIWNNEDVFGSVGMLAGSASILTHSKKERIWTGLIGSLLGVSSANAGTKGLQQLVLLNAALPSADEGAAPLPQPRAMNLIRHLLSWVDEENEEIELSPGLIVEISKALCSILKIVKGMYGGHWQSAFDFMKGCWEACVGLDDGLLPMVSSTLKLLQVLRSLLGENDDLDDAWAETNGQLYARLLELLLHAGRPDNMHQPRSIVNTQIARQLRDIDVTMVEDLSSVYPLLGTQSRSIQKAAFDILHRYIPTAQEQISVDVALSAEAASSLQLPPEILSMIIEAPELPEDADIEQANEVPIAVRGYLLSWILIFDHFQNASFKVKSIYMDTLKEGQYMTPLLEFISATLFSHGRTFDASKVDIQSYTVDITENPLQDIRWLQTHLYYLTLRYTPSLVKTWWLDTERNRATVLAVEAFTEKYMSPLLIDNELTAVAEWVRAGGEAEEDGMKIKVARSAKEVSASYPVDDQAMDILVKLPAIFPLRQVEVTGLRRVGLDEKRFKQMQLASQAVVNFQSGSIIDALTLFRKNVSLHFQGISECAVCYSILAVTPDRSLPNRGCTTCKNKFHSTCLFKWFKTSNSSSCPLCRTSFSFYS